MEIGQRVCHPSDKVDTNVASALSEFPCRVGTVRYIGSLKDDVEQSTWVGVEWDDGDVGKSNGMVGGENYFVCEEGRSGSFLKLNSLLEPRSGDENHNSDTVQMNRVDDRFLSHVVGVDFATAVLNRYVLATDLSLDEKMQIIDSKTGKMKPMEFIGREKVAAYFKNLQELRVLTVSRCRISKADSVVDKSDQDSLNLECVETLYLDANLLFEWNEIHKILLKMPKLAVVNLDNNTLNQAPEQTPEESVNQGIVDLSLNRTGISIPMLSFVDSAFPNLQGLSLCLNRWEQIPGGAFCISSKNANVPAVGNQSLFCYLESLNMSSNSLSSWSDLAECLKLPLLKKLHFAENGLGDDIRPLQEASFIQSQHGEKMEELVLDDNKISEWSTIACLTVSFPNLKFLRWLGNPLCPRAFGDDGNNNDSRFVIIPLFPKLLMLNGSEVSRKERVVAEKYFLSLVSRASPLAITLDPTKSIGQRLTSIHGDIWSVSGEGESAHTDGKSRLARSLVAVTLEPEFLEHINSSTRIYKKKLPGNLKVSELKVLCGKLFGVPTPKIYLTYVEARSMLRLKLEEDSKTLDCYGVLDNSKISVNTKQ